MYYFYRFCLKMGQTAYEDNFVPESFATLPPLCGATRKLYFPSNSARIEDYKENYHWGILFNSLQIYTITSVRIKPKAKVYH